MVMIGKGDGSGSWFLDGAEEDLEEARVGVG